MDDACGGWAGLLGEEGQGGREVDPEASSSSSCNYVGWLRIQCPTAHDRIPPSHLGPLVLISPLIDRSFISSFRRSWMDGGGRSRSQPFSSAEKWNGKQWPIAHDRIHLSIVPPWASCSIPFPLLHFRPLVQYPHCSFIRFFRRSWMDGCGRGRFRV